MCRIQAMFKQGNDYQPDNEDRNAFLLKSGRNGVKMKQTETAENSKNGTVLFCFALFYF